jgi:Nucleotidyl transferase AbiEii toxin, Type IV TA system
LNALDPRLVEDVASRLDTDEGLVEKDWHVVRAIAIVAAVDHDGMKPAFSGGTSLSAAWGLIKRFSEDIDFKVATPTASSTSQARASRRRYREKVLAAIEAADFEVIDKPLGGRDGGFFSANIGYRSEFTSAPGLRPHLRMEMTFEPPALPPIERPIRSLIALAQNQPPEIAAFPCVDPIETAADKLSALAWRVCVRQRGSDTDDPTIIRHLHDLAALELRVINAPAFKALVEAAMTADTGRGGGQAPANPAERCAIMFDRLATDKLWAEEYAEFVRNVSFAGSGEEITFEIALEAARRLANATALHQSESSQGAVTDD